MKVMAPPELEREGDVRACRMVLGRSVQHVVVLGQAGPRSFAIRLGFGMVPNRWFAIRPGSGKVPTGGLVMAVGCGRASGEVGRLEWS